MIYCYDVIILSNQKKRFIWTELQRFLWLVEMWWCMMTSILQDYISWRLHGYHFTPSCAVNNHNAPFNKWVWTIFYLFETFMLHLKQWILHWKQLHSCLNNIWTNAVKFVTIKSDLFHWCAVCFNHFTLSEQNRGLFKSFVKRCIKTITIVACRREYLTCSFFCKLH